MCRRSEANQYGLEEKVKNWEEGKIQDHIFLIAINVCHSDSFSDDLEQAIFGHPEFAGDAEENFLEYLSCVNGVIVFRNARCVMSATPQVRLYKNGKRIILGCLRFLLQERRLGDLLGIGTQ